MLFIRDASGFVGQWVADRSNSEVKDGTMSFGFIENGKLVAGVSLVMREHNSCALVVAATTPRWCLPGYLKEMFGYVFDSMGVKYLYTLADTKNLKSNRLSLGLGFRPDGKLRGVGTNGDDLNLYGMLREDCKFLTEEYRDEAHSG